MAGEGRDPERLHRRQAGVEAAGDEAPDLIERALPYHRLEPRIDAAIETVARQLENHLEHAPFAVGRLEGPRFGVLLIGGKRPPGRLDHFERAHDALRIGGPEPRRHRRIAFGELTVKGSGALCGEPLADADADRRRNCRHRRETMKERAEIEAGAADQNGQAPGPPCGVDLGTGEIVPASGGTGIGGIEDAIEPVWHPCRLVGFGARGEDREVAIDLHRVGVDDDAPVPLGEGKGECRLAARRRPCDKNRAPVHTGIPAFMPNAPFNSVATLVVKPDADVRAAAAALEDALATAGATLSGRAPLGPDALDIAFSGVPLPVARAIARRVAEAHDADCAVQPVAGRRKRLLIADMDSTMITVECIDELADLVGCKAEVAAVTEAAMRGEIDFAGALRARVALLAGLSLSYIRRCLDARVRPSPGAETLLRTMAAAGAHTLLVSGGFTIFAEPVAARLGFHAVRANRLALVGDRLTGSVVPPIVDAAAKRAALLDLCAGTGIARQETLAVGDGANDIPMIEAAGIGVAYRGKPRVAAAADATVRHGDLTALLYFQGYRRTEFVSSGA